MATHISEEQKRNKEQRRIEELKNMLLLTNDSKLTHIMRGSDNITFWDTMKIRQRFRE